MVLGQFLVPAFRETYSHRYSWLHQHAAVFAYLPFRCVCGLSETTVLFHRQEVIERYASWLLLQFEKKACTFHVFEITASLTFKLENDHLVIQQSMKSTEQSELRAL
jgi:hypothetical protein